jgi:predicted enzyme related to lactoylglutathione lyase
MAPDFGNGKICYIEMPAIDIKRSADFYATVFGWNVRTRGDGSIAFDDGVGQVSGTWRTDRPARTESPGMLIYIMVDDIEASLALVTANGGKIVQGVGADHPEITARFTDPAGNLFGLYQHRG